MAAAQPVPAQPVSAQVVGNAFVQQYYHILHHSPGLVHRFYQDISKLGRPNEDGSMSITTTMQAINEKIISLNYSDFRAEIRSVDAQESFSGGVQVLVTGYLTGKDSMMKNFAQTFFLAPQDSGYFVLNDVFRYVETGTQNVTSQGLVADAVSTSTPDQNPIVAENDIHEQNTLPAEEANGGEVYNPPENGDVVVVEEEPVAEVVDEVQDDSQVVVESESKSDEMPKKSYASIVMHLKESAATFSPPPPIAHKSAPKNQDSVNQTSASVTDVPVLNSDAVDDGNNQEEEAESYSIYVKGLPMSATPAMLHEEFKKFGPIKTGGIQVRSNRQQGFCFGFVQFEVPEAVQKALEASPVSIGGRPAAVEEKRSTNSRVNNNKGRFPPGRGSGFRNEGMRGRGNYGGGRGYGRNDFGGRNEYGNRGGSRGGPLNRDAYQRDDNNTNNGGRSNHPAGMANGNAKNTGTRVA